MLIEVAETHSPQQGKKVGHIKTRTGQTFEVWPDKLAGFQIGGRYRIEVAEREYQGRTIRKITKAQPADGAAPPANGKRPNAQMVHSADRKFDRVKIERMKREALQIAVLLPSSREEALAVLAFTQELVDKFLCEGGER